MIFKAKIYDFQSVKILFCKAENIILHSEKKRKQQKEKAASCRAGVPHGKEESALTKLQTVVQEDCIHLSPCSFEIRAQAVAPYILSSCRTSRHHTTERRRAPSAITTTERSPAHRTRFPSSHNRTKPCLPHGLPVTVNRKNLSIARAFRHRTIERPPTL